MDPLRFGDVQGIFKKILMPGLAVEYFSRGLISAVIICFLIELYLLNQQDIEVVAIFLIFCSIFGQSEFYAGLIPDDYLVLSV